MTLGERIKTYRKQIGYSQERLAEQLGVSRQAIAKWEANQSAPSTGHLLQLAELFETTADLLLESPKPADDSIARQVYQLYLEDRTKQQAARGMHIRQNLCAALWLLLGYFLFYLAGRWIWCDPNNSSVIGWLFFSRPQGSHSYLYGWILSSNLFWWLLGGSLILALCGKRHTAWTVFFYHLAGFLLGLLLGPNEAGKAYGQSHFGWAYWCAMVLTALPIGLMLEKLKKPEYSLSTRKGKRLVLLFPAGILAATILIAFLIPDYR